MTGLISATGIKETGDGGEVLKVLGGSMRIFGEERAKVDDKRLSDFKKPIKQNGNKNKVK